MDETASAVGSYAGLEPVELDEQHRGGVARVAGADEVLDGAGDLGVHHLERRGHDPGRDDPADRGRGVVDAWRSRAAACAPSGGFGGEAHRDPRRDAHRPLAAHEAASQVVARRDPGSSPPSRATVPSVRTTSSASTCVVVTPDARQCGPPAFVATLPTDRARGLRRRIGCVVEAEVTDRTAQIEVEDPGLDPCDPRARRRPRARGSAAWSR